MQRLRRICGGGGAGSGNRGMCHAAALVAGILTFAGVAGPVQARQQIGIRSGPVYMDDSPRTVDGLIRAAEMAALGNPDESVRVLQTLLDEEADRVVAAREDPDLFTSVRSRVMQMIQSDARLLERYRALETPVAERLLESGEVEKVERAYLLTLPGFEAALRIAQAQAEDAQFDAARRTLLQLENHPDRSAERATDAAKLLSLVASHIGAGRTAAEREALRSAAIAEASRWRQQAKLPAVDLAAAAEPTILVERTPYVPADAELDVSQLLARPLWSDSLGDALPLALPPNAARQANAPPEGAALLFAPPTVVGDTVFVNNSETISAWNRFTLSPRWRVKLQGPVSDTIQLGGQRTIEELSTVEVSDGIAVALTGLRVGGQMQSERRLVAIDAQTGRPLWNRRIDDFKQAGLEDSAIRSPLIVDQGLVIFGVEKDISRRRLDSYYLVAVDLRTGEFRWSRPVGSSGAVNMGFRAVINDGLAAYGGVLYITSRIGFVAAIEVATGRPIWIRRIEVTAIPNSRTDLPWEINIPLLVGDRLFTLSPSRTEILSLDAHTGALLARRPSADFNAPDYLLYAEGWLLVVSPATIDAVEANDLADGLIRRVLALSSGGPMRGRVGVLGDTLLVPALGEVQLYGLQDMGRGPIARVTLDRPGTALALEGQLIVVDDAHIHTYLVWSVAERMLRQRMEDAPNDPEPAVTYAELSYRAGRPEGVAPAIDRALAAVERDPLGPDMAAVQARMFRSILQMVEPDAEAPALKPLDDETRGVLIERLGLCASTTEDQVAYLLTAGRHYEATERPALAVRSYQAVLDAPELAAASYASAGTTVSADFEATRRLRRVIQMHGRALYDAYQSDADRMLAQLGNQARDPEPFEVIARRYPLSHAAVRAWTEAGTRYAAQQRPQLAALAFEEGLAAARDALPEGDPLLGELAGRLVQSLVRADLLYPAQDTLQRLLAERPNLSMTEDGAPIDARALLASLQSRLAQGEPRPRLGPVPVASAPMAGWVIESPDAIDDYSQSPDYILLRGEDEGVSMFKAEGPGALARLWGDVRNHVYLWMDRTGVVFSQETGEGNTVDVAFTKRELESGRVMWKTPNFRSLQTQNAVDDLLARGMDQQIPEIDTPLRPRARVTEVLYAHDERTLIALDRVGRAAAFDLETGRTLWTRADLMARVHGAAVRSGVLVIGGSDAPVDLRNPSRDPGNLASSGVVIALDARGGQTIHRAPIGGRVRWVRLAPEGAAIVGLDRSIISIDVFRRAVRWRAEARQAQETIAAWALPGRVIVRRDDGRLWQIRTSDGFVRLEPLDTRDRLESNYRRLSITALGDAAALATERGLALYDREGNLLGLDFRETAGPILFGGWGETYVPTLDRGGENDLDGLNIHHLNVYETATLRAVSRTGVTLGVAGLDSRPMSLMNGKVLISTGSITTVIDMPPDPAAAPPGGAGGAVGAQLTPPSEPRP